MVRSRETEDKQMDETKGLRVIKQVILLVYIGIMALCIYRHEPFCDETQAWLLTKNLTFSELFMQLHIEGHPIGWFLILIPLAKLGLPFWTVYIVCFAVLCFSAYFLLYKIEGVPLTVKFSALISVIFFYKYTAAARPYSICVLLVLLYVYYYPRRKEKVLPFAVCAALLVQMHVYMSPLTIATILLLGWECIQDKDRRNKKTTASILLMLVSVLFMVIQLLQVGRTHAQMDVSFTVIMGKIVCHPMIYLRDLAASWRNNFWFFTTYNQLLRKGVTVLAFLFAVFVLLMVRKIPKVSFLFLFSEWMVLTAMLYIRDEPGPGYILLMAYVLLLFREKQHFAAAYGVMAIWIMCCVISFMSVSRIAWKDLVGEISGGRAMATYINTNLPDGSIVLIENTGFESNVIAETKKTVTYFDCEAGGKYVMRDLSRVAGTEEDIQEKLVVTEKAKNQYILVNHPLEQEKLLGQCVLLYGQDYEIYYNNEAFWLYEVRNER